MSGYIPELRRRREGCCEWDRLVSLVVVVVVVVVLIR